MVFTISDLILFHHIPPLITVTPTLRWKQHSWFVLSASIVTKYWCTVAAGIGDYHRVLITDMDVRIKVVDTKQLSLLHLINSTVTQRSIAVEVFAGTKLSWFVGLCWLTVCNSSFLFHGWWWSCPNKAAGMLIMNSILVEGEYTRQKNILRLLGKAQLITIYT